MNQIELKVGGKIYRLNNNSNKYDRAIADAGPNPTPEKILAHYHKHEGYIEDEKYQKILNGTFWQEYKKSSKKEQELKEKVGKFVVVTSHPVISSLITISILFSIWYFFGLDLSRFSNT